MEALFGAVMRRFKVRLVPLIISFSDKTRLSKRQPLFFCFLRILTVWHTVIKAV